MPAESPAPPAHWRRAAPHWIAAAVFAVAAALAFSPVWLAGADGHLPVRPGVPPGAEAPPPDSPLARGLERFERVSRADVIFEAWLVSRHARTLVTRPWRLYDTEHCFPAEKTLTLGIPMITLGVLAVPVFAVTGDPILTYNVVLVLLSLLGALAMYALVVAWTGVPGAGIAAGLLYAFHPTRLADVTHPSVWDTTWTVLALLFAERLLARGRWRDALGLAAAAALQVAASFYPLLAALLLGVPFLAWLLLRDGLRRIAPAQIACVLGALALAAALVLGPYLGAEPGTGDGALRRDHFVYVYAAALAPGGWLFPGVSTLLLAALALAARRDRVLPEIAGDPRPALLAGAALCAWLAAGDAAAPLPNLHAALAGLLPGFDAVRVVLRVFAGTHLALVVLAGLGAAALVRFAGRAGAGVAVALVLACGFDVLRAPSLGIERSYAWTLEAFRPDPQERAFFAELARRGNDGPLLEVPLGQAEGLAFVGPPRIVLSLYHGRRTSACFGSYPPPGREALAELAWRLPDPQAVAALAELGFTTVVFRPATAGPAALRLLARVDAAARRGGGLRHVYSTPRQRAFELVRPQAARASAPAR